MTYTTDTANVFPSNSAPSSSSAIFFAVSSSAKAASIQRSPGSSLHFADIEEGDPCFFRSS